MAEISFTTLCYIEKENQYLMMHRVKKQNDLNKDKWVGIGGHFMEGETPEECLLREVKEETGLNIYAPQLCGIKDWYENQCRYVVLFYKTTCFDGELCSSEEGEVWWEELDNLPNLNLSLDMNDMLRVFMEEGLSEFFYFQKDNEWMYELK